MVRRKGMARRKGMEGGQVKTYFIKAEFDDEAGVWYVSQTDVPGLAVEAETPEKLLDILKVLVPQLAEANGHLGHGYPDVPYSVMLDSLRALRASYG